MTACTAAHANVHAPPRATSTARACSKAWCASCAAIVAVAVGFGDLGDSRAQDQSGEPSAPAPAHGPDAPERPTLAQPPTLLAAPPAAPKRRPVPTCTGAVDGHVVDATIHEPLAGAAVRMGGADVGATDDDGRFALTGLCPGSLQLTVELAGYLLARETVTVGASTSVEIELQPESDEIIVIAADAPRDDMRSTTVLSGEALERTRGRGLSEALSEVPGVTMLRSGSGLAKPIVRGQFGRRLLMLVDNVRHRSQDWGLDHAPEIDPFIADRLTVVRGAAGVQFGPDAIGGAVLVDPPRLRFLPGVIGEAHMLGFYPSGGSLAARAQGGTAGSQKLAWQIEGSGKRLAAPITPDYALENTSSAEWNLGATVGYRPGRLADDRGEVTLSYRHYHARLGVCGCLRMESSEDFFAQLEQDRPVDAHLYRSDFDIDRSYQEVDHDLFIVRARRPMPSFGTLTATYALQYDYRREFDVVRTATGPQFSFRLTTNDLDVGVAHNPLHLTDHLHLRGSFGLVGMVQVHDFGGLSLVPDHQALAGGAYLIERLVGHDYAIEAGVRYDATGRSASIARNDYLRLVRSDQLDMEACASEDGDRFLCDSRFHTLSASLGGQLQLSDPLSVKLDLSTASRPPNPDEQYLNGTSPTFPVLGLGKPDLAPETTYSASLTTSFNSARVAAEASAYSNYISDYIYFAPAIGEDGMPIFDVLIRGSFPRFVTRPVDALFYGFDGGISVRPVPSLQLDGQLSIVRARNLTDDSYLVFVPPDRARVAATYERENVLGLPRASASISGTYVARQNRFDIAADLAPPPDGYFLLDAELGAETRVADQNVKIALQGTNLLNRRYRDYTSLLRYFADQPGWRLMLRLTVRYASQSRR